MYKLEFHLVSLRQLYTWLYKVNCDHCVCRSLSLSLSRIKLAGHPARKYIYNIARESSLTGFLRMKFHADGRLINKVVRNPEQSALIPAWACWHLTCEVQRYWQQYPPLGMYAEWMFYEGIFYVPKSILNLKKKVIQSLMQISQISRL